MKTEHKAYCVSHLSWTNLTKPPHGTQLVTKFTMALNSIIFYISDEGVEMAVSDMNRVFHNGAKEVQKVKRNPMRKKRLFESKNIRNYLEP